MKKQRKTYTTEFKVKIALEAIKAQRTINEISGHYSIHPNQVTQWKKQALDGLPDAFSSRRARAAEDEEATKAQLYQQIGQLKVEHTRVELDWLKKNQDCSVDHKRQLIESSHDSLSVRRQCLLAGLPRASFYYQPQPESAENWQLMRLLDEQYMRTPFYAAHDGVA